MKLFEIESTDIITPITRDQMSKILDANCSISRSSVVRLYRGASDKGDQFLGKIRIDRRALSSSKQQITLFNKLFENVGLPFRKENTLSVSVDRHQARDYGSAVYAIFPFNGAQYFYVKDVTDLMFFPTKFVLFVASIKHNITDDDLSIEAQKNLMQMRRIVFENPDEYVKQYGKKFMDTINIHVTSEPNDIEHRGEVLVYGTNYIGIKQ